MGTDLILVKDKALLRERQRFLPLGYEKYLFNAYQTCVQRNMNVYDCTAKFLRLLAKI